MIKIAVTGPHCCGKSTVLGKVQNYFKENDKIKFEKFNGSLSPVDYSSSKKLKNSSKSEIDITYWMISNMINREINLHYDDTNKIVLLDRCIVDQIVYPAVLLDEKFQYKIYEFIELWLYNHPYDIIFYIPKNYELLQKYGTKDKSIEYVDAIEEKYLDTLKKLGVKYIILPKNQEEQVNYIIEYLKNLI